MKSIYSGFLIHPKFGSRRRFYRLSNATLRSLSSAKPELCRNFPSSNPMIAGHEGCVRHGGAEIIIDPHHPDNLIAYSPVITPV
jgi:hypothetical protein